MQRGEKIILFKLNFKRFISFIAIVFNTLSAIDYVIPKYNDALNDSIIIGCMDDSICNFGSGPVDCACNYNQNAIQDTACLDTDGICNYAVFPSNPQINETLGSCRYNRDCLGNCLADADLDGICDTIDNCILDYNPSQEDSDMDGLGNVCDEIDGCFGNYALFGKIKL